MGNPVVHFEVVGEDAKALQTFYGKAFGWEIKPVMEGYARAHPGAAGGINGGVGAATGGSAGHVTFYVEVDDLGAALKKIESLGDKTLQPPMDVPGCGAADSRPGGHTGAAARVHRPPAPAAGRAALRAVNMAEDDKIGGAMTTEHTKSADTEANCVRKAVSVQAPPAVAWRVFTEKMGTWWPLATYKIGKAGAVDAVIEPRVGGRWFERGEDGSTCDWGRVLSWEPPSRLVLSWDISADWQPDPNVKSEVEIRFIAEGKDATRVELEHRKLDRFGARRDEMRGIFDSEGGWGGLLQTFVERAASAA